MVKMKTQLKANLQVNEVPEMHQPASMLEISRHSIVIRDSYTRQNQEQPKKTKTDIDNNFVPQLGTMPFNSAGAPPVGMQSHNQYFLPIDNNQSM